jgi:transcriptional regulator with XRE-family HTH domain
MDKPRAFLDSQGITQTELGEDLGMTGAAVSRKLAGLRHWKLIEVRSALEFLSERLGRAVTYEEVFGVDDGAARIGTTGARTTLADTTHSGRTPRRGSASHHGRGCVDLLPAGGARPRRRVNAD